MNASNLLCITFFLIATLSIASSQNTSNFSFAQNTTFNAYGSVLSVGSYALYQPSNLSLQYLLGYTAGVGPSSSDQLQFLNRTTLNYSLKDIIWRIEDLPKEYIKVNYTIEFFNASSEQVTSPFVLSEEILVSTLNAYAYATNGTYLGQWPYWLPSSAAIGANVTLLHNYPLYGCDYAGNCGITNLTVVEFLSHPLGNGLPVSPTNSSTFIDTTLSLPSIGSFRSDRLIISYPYLSVSHCNTLTDCEKGIFNSSGPVVVEGIPTPNWVAVYDQLSGIMLALQRDDWFVDDVILHSSLHVWHIGFRFSSLVLAKTNIRLAPDNQTNMGIPLSYLFLSAGIIVAISTISIYYYFKRNNLSVNDQKIKERANNQDKW